MIQAVNAVALNVAILADSFNAKLASLNDDVKRYYSMYNEFKLFTDRIKILIKYSNMQL